MLGPDSSGDTGSGIGSESGAGNNYRLPTLFFFRSATYTSYYSYMQLNKLFTIMTFPACMVHVLPTFLTFLWFFSLFSTIMILLLVLSLTCARSHVGNYKHEARGASVYNSLQTARAVNNYFIARASVLRMLSASVSIAM